MNQNNKNQIEPKYFSLVFDTHFTRTENQNNQKKQNRTEIQNFHP